MVKLKKVKIEELKIGNLLLWKEKTHFWNKKRSKLLGILTNIKKVSPNSPTYKFTIFFPNTKEFKSFQTILKKEFSGEIICLDN